MRTIWCDKLHVVANSSLSPTASRVHGVLALSPILNQSKITIYNVIVNSVFRI